MSVRGYTPIQEPCHRIFGLPLSPHPTVQNELPLPVISTCTHYVNELSPQATLAHHCEASTLHLELSLAARYSVHSEGLLPYRYASTTIETNRSIGISQINRHLAPLLLTSTAPDPRKPLFYLSQRFCVIPMHSPHKSALFLFFPPQKNLEKNKSPNHQKKTRACNYLLSQGFFGMVCVYI